MKTGIKNGFFARSGRGRMALGLALLATLATMAGCAGSGPDVRPQDELRVNVDEILTQRAAHPAEPYYPYEMARWNRQAGRTAEARAHLDTALTLDPDYAPAAALLSRMHYESGRHDAAVLLLEDFLARNPEAPDALRVALALNLQALEDFDRSAAVLATCRDKSGPVSTALTFTHLQGDAYLTALPVARAAVKDNPHSAANHNNLGISLLYAGQPDEARTAFLHAVELDPELPGPLYNLAIVANFYFFDPDTGRDYFRRYQTAAAGGPVRDPDDLGTALGMSTTTASRLPDETSQAALMPVAAGGDHAP